MRGRKPIPTVIKIARGNPGDHKLNEDEAEPSREIDLAVPAILASSPDARAAWDELAPMLHRLGLLTEADRNALILYCSTFAIWQAAERDVQTRGLVLKIKGRKTLLTNPYLHIRAKAQEQCKALLVEFGLTPVSRARTHVPKQAKADLQRERFFGPAPRVKPA